MKAAKAIQILGNILLILAEFFQAGKNMFADNAKSSLFLPIQNWRQSHLNSFEYLFRFDNFWCILAYQMLSGTCQEKGIILCCCHLSGRFLI